MTHHQGTTTKSIAPAQNYRGAFTPVYSAGHSPVFHADLNCDELRALEEVNRWPLGWLLTRERNPRKPCSRCTHGKAHTARVALAYDGVEPDALRDEYRGVAPEVEA